MVGQPSTNPNKAFWEAITLVGILLAVLLLSVLHIKGWLPGSGSVSDTLPSTTAAPPLTAPSTAVPAGPPPATPAPETPATVPPDSSVPPRDEGPRDPEPPAGGAMGSTQRRDHDSTTVSLPGGHSASVHFDPNQGPKNVKIGVTQIGPDGRPIRLGIPSSQPGTPFTPRFNNLQGQGLVAEPVTPYMPRMYTQATPGEIRAGVPVSAAPQHSTFQYLPWATGRDPIGRPVPGPGDRPLTAGHNPRVLDQLRPDQVVSPSRVDAGHAAPSPGFENPYWVPSSEVLTPGGTRIPLTPGGVHVKPGYVRPEKVKIPVDIKDPIPTPQSARTGQAAAQAEALRKAARDAEKVKKRQTNDQDATSPVEQEEKKKDKVKQKKEKIWVRDPVTGQVKEVEVISEKTVGVDDETEPAKAKAKKTKEAVFDEVSPTKDKVEDKEGKREKVKKGRRLSVEEDDPATVKKKDKAKADKEKIAVSESEEEIVVDGKKVKGKKKERRLSAEEEAAKAKKTDKAKKEKEKVAVSSSEEEVVMDDGRKFKRKKKKKEKLDVDDSGEDLKAKDKTKSKKKTKAKASGDASESEDEEVTEIDVKGVKRKVKKEVKDKEDQANIVQDDGPAPAKAKVNKQKQAAQAGDDDDDYLAEDDAVDSKSNAKSQPRKQRMDNTRPDMAQPQGKPAPSQPSQRQQANIGLGDDYADSQPPQRMQRQQQGYNNLAPPPPPPIRQPQESRAQYEKQVDDHAQQSIQYQRDLRAAEQDDRNGVYAKNNKQPKKGKTTQAGDDDEDDGNAQGDDSDSALTGKLSKQEKLQQSLGTKKKGAGVKGEEDMDENNALATKSKSKKNRKPDGLSLGAANEVETVGQVGTSEEETEESDAGEGGSFFGRKKKNKRNRVNDVDEEQPPTPASVIAAREELAKENGGFEQANDLGNDLGDIMSDDEGTKQKKKRTVEELAASSNSATKPASSAASGNRMSKSQAQQIVQEENEDNLEETESEVDSDYGRQKKRPQRVRNVQALAEIQARTLRENANKEDSKDEDVKLKEEENQQQRQDTHTPGVLSEKVKQKVQDAEEAYINQDQYPNPDSKYDIEAAKVRKAKQATQSRGEEENTSGLEVETAANATDKRKESPEDIAEQDIQEVTSPEVHEEDPGINSIKKAAKSSEKRSSRFKEQLPEVTKERSDSQISAKAEEDMPSPRTRAARKKELAEMFPQASIEGAPAKLPSIASEELKRETRFRADGPSKDDLKAQLLKDQNVIGSTMAYNKERKGQRANASTWKEQQAEKVALPDDNDDSEGESAQVGGKESANDVNIGYNQEREGQRENASAWDRQKADKVALPADDDDSEEESMQVRGKDSANDVNIGYNQERKGQRENAPAWDRQQADKVTLPEGVDDDLEEGSSVKAASKVQNENLKESSPNEEHLGYKAEREGQKAHKAGWRKAGAENVPLPTDEDKDSDWDEEEHKGGIAQVHPGYKAERDGQKANKESWSKAGAEKIPLPAEDLQDEEEKQKNANASVKEHARYKAERDGQKANKEGWSKAEAEKVPLPAAGEDSDWDEEEKRGRNVTVQNGTDQRKSWETRLFGTSTGSTTAQASLKPNGGWDFGTDHGESNSEKPTQDARAKVDTSDIDLAATKERIKDSKPSNNNFSRQEHKRNVDCLKGQGPGTIIEEDEDEIAESVRPPIDPVEKDTQIVEHAEVSPLGKEYENLPRPTRGEIDDISPMSSPGEEILRSTAAVATPERVKSKTKKAHKSEADRESAWTADDADAQTEVDSDDGSFSKGSKERLKTKDAPPMPQAMPAFTTDLKNAKAAQLDEIARHQDPAPITVNRAEVDNSSPNDAKVKKRTEEKGEKSGEGWDSDSTSVGDEPSSPGQKEKAKLENARPANKSIPPEREEDVVAKEKREAKERYDAQKNAIKEMARKKKEERLATESAKNEARGRRKKDADDRDGRDEPTGTATSQADDANGEIEENDDQSKSEATNEERDPQLAKRKARQDKEDSSGVNETVKELERLRAEREIEETNKAKEAEKRKSMGIPHTMATGSTPAEVKKMDTKVQGEGGGEDDDAEGKGDVTQEETPVDAKESPNPKANVFNHNAKVKDKKKLTKEERKKIREERRARRQQTGQGEEGETTDGMTDSERKKQKKREKRERKAKKEAEGKQQPGDGELSEEETAVPEREKTRQDETSTTDQQPSRAQQAREERRREREQKRNRDQDQAAQDPLQTADGAAVEPPEGDVQEVGAKANDDPSTDSSETAIDTPGETPNDDRGEKARKLRKDELKKNLQEDDEATKGETTAADNDRQSRATPNRKDQGAKDEVENGSVGGSSKQAQANGDSASNPIGPWAIARRIAHILRHAPLYSLLTFATVILWMEGARQIGNIVVLSSTSGQTTPNKRTEDPDLELSTSVTSDLLKQKSLDPTAMFVLLNLFMFVGVLLTGLFLSLAVGKANGDPKRSTGEPWYRHPTQPLRSAAKGLLQAISPLLMGANLHGPMTLFRRSSWKTYVRLFLFSLQGVITLLLLRQGLSFMYLVNNTGTSYSDLPDIRKSSGMAEVAKSISPGTALVIIGTIIGVCIFALSVGWYALLNPHSDWSGGGVSFGKYKGNTKMITAFKLIGAGVISVTFVGLMFFFGEITTYAMGANVPTSTYNINLLAANGILIVFVIPLGWSLLVIWDAIGGLRSKIKQSSLSCV